MTKIGACFVSLCCVIWAQSTAQISGTVTDQTGAAVAGAQVTATQLRPTNSRGQPPAGITPQSVGITPYYEPTNNAILGLSLSGGFSIGGQCGNVPGLTNSTAFEESEDISWVKGAHQIGFGLENIHARLNVTGWTNADGSFSFTGMYTGMGLGDFMLGDDRKHNFNITAVYITPQYATRTLRLLGSGWQVAGILRIYSGDYFSLSSGLDQALTGTDDQRPQQVRTNVYCANRSVSCWLNPAAFAQPALGTYGNMGPGTIEGPGFLGST